MTNPYQAPSAALIAPPSSESVWREGGTVVLTPGAPLPDRCFKCNLPADGYRLKRTLYWHSPWLYLLVIPAACLYFIIALLVRRKARIELPLCGRHARARRIQVGVTVATALGSVVALMTRHGLLSLMLFVVAVVAGMVASRVVQARRIEADRVRLGGAGEAFLSELADLP